MGRLALTVAFVLAVGLPPARAMVRGWSIAVPLAGVTSGLVLTVAAIGSLLSGTPLRPWVLGVVAAAWGASAYVARRRRRRAPGGADPSRAIGASGPGLGGGTTGCGPPGSIGVAPLRSLVLPAAISAPLLTASLSPPTEFDARAIWFFHARWFWEGGDTAQAAMANAAFSYSHADYPPLVPASTAALWSLTGRADLRLAQAVTSVQTWLVVLLVVTLVAGLAGRRAEVAVALAGGLFAVGCFGVAGGFGTRGYADLLWAAMAAAGALAALVLPVDAAAAGLAVICLVAAVLTKGEGLVTVTLLFGPFAGLRWFVVARRRALPWLAGLAGVVLAAGTWLLIASRLVTHPRRDVTPASLWAFLEGDPAKDGRLEPALRGLWGFSRGTLLTAGVIAVIGVVLLRRRRRQQGLGSGLWLPTAAVGAFWIFVVVLAAGELDVNYWVEAGGFRTMTVVRVLLLTEVLVTVALALDALLPSERDGQPSEEPSGSGHENHRRLTAR